MRFLKYLLVIVATVLVTLGIVYGFSCVSCDSCDTSGGQSSGEEAAVRTAVTLSADTLDGDEYFTDTDEVEEYEGSPQWLVVTFDVVFIALTIGVIVLCWWLYKRFVRNLNRRNRRFG